MGNIIERVAECIWVSLRVRRHRHYIHRLHLPAHSAIKIWNIVIMDLATAESLLLKCGHMLVNLFLNPKLIFSTLSTSIYLISMFGGMYLAQYNHLCVSHCKIRITLTEGTLLVLFEIWGEKLVEQQGIKSNNLRSKFSVRCLWPLGHGDPRRV